MHQETAVHKLADVAAVCQLLYLLNEKSGGQLTGTLLLVPEAWGDLEMLDLESHVEADLQVAYSDHLDYAAARYESMTDAYLNGNWEDPIPLLEWCGFLLGGGIVQLASAQAYAVADDQLSEKLQKIRAALNKLFTQANQSLNGLVLQSTRNQTQPQ